MKCLFSLIRRSWFLFCTLFFFSMSASAVDLFNVDNNPLPLAQAYQFSAVRDANTVNAHWQMAPGYYLYQDRFCFIVNGQRITGIKLPPAQTFTDDILGRFNAYANQLNITIPIPPQYANQTVNLNVCYQGCSSKHFCYPPVTKALVLPALLGRHATTVAPKPASPVAQNEQDKLSSLLSGHNIGWALLSFFGLGLLLAFTPCILPMIPILSSLIIGHEGISTARAAWISLTYVLSMALTYAVIGLIAGFVGANLQALLQTPLAIAISSLLFVLLALSLFGFYEIRLPRRLQERLTDLSNHQKSGHFVGAAVMGCLATLIVSPCVSPALIAAVGYITQTGNGLLGGLALFTMALGMGIPLFLVGTFGGRILPRTGHWMETIKQILGVFLLAIAIALLNRILPGRVSLLLWAVLLIISSIYLGLLQPAVTGWAKFWRGLGLVFAMLGAILLLGAAQGNTSLWQPLTPWTNANAAPENNSSEFSVVTTRQGLNSLLAHARQNHKITVIDFYARWCLACQEMDIRTFNKTNVKTTLLPFERVRVDMTKNTPEMKALLKEYNVIAPPTIIFINPQGQEMTESRIVGAVGATTFLQHLNMLHS
ncbi:MAG: protein-disulfide reductase DsbD [Gammaproteobacteria bacterium]|nr:protein-disulfide reductase DsbD [Gammaproteobacteria bacterium]